MHRSFLSDVFRVTPRFGVLIFLVIFMSSGCTDEPSGAGIGILPPEDLPVFEVDTLFATDHASVYTTISTSTQDPFVPTWAPTTLLLGQQNTLVAGTYVKFLEFPDSLQGISISSAELILYSKSAYGDSVSLTTGQYSVFQGRGSWEGDSLTYDSLDALPGTYFDPAPRPIAAGTVRNDTGTISLPIDTAMVREWFRITLDEATNQGVFLTSQTPNTIWGFWSFLHPRAELFPMLRISYEKNGVTGSYTHQKGFSRYLAKVPQQDLVTDPAKIYVQTGVSYRGSLTFDLSTLPIPVSVNAARLYLTLDTTASDINAFGTDSLVVFGVRSDGSVEQVANGLGIPVPEPGRRAYDFRADVIFRYWQSQNLQARMVIAGLAENSTITRFVFHGPSAPIPFRPMLVLTYSKVLKSADARGGH